MYSLVVMPVNFDKLMEIKMLKSTIQFKNVILFLFLLLALTQTIAAPVITKHTKISASFDSELKLNHG